MWWSACASEPGPVEVPEDAPFVRARIEEGGLCGGPLCGGYVEVWGEGTLRSREGRDGRVEERALTADEWADAEPVLADEALWALLRDGCEPVGVPIDSYQALTVETWDELWVSYDLCDDAPMIAAWDVLRALVP